MSKFFLTLHVLAAVLGVGPVAVAASMFPRTLRTADAAGDPAAALTTLGTLHRITRVYAAVSLAVPVFGFATASSMHVLGTPWLIASIILTALAAVCLFALLPLQENAMEAPAAALAPRLAMIAGVFNLLWAAVTVLMIVRPGSSTGA
ncbi:hypothetical protein [Actinacidiphila acididurans]|uniref:Integral membrane protein n=1 Tax=Actinacidiphila acididurans TaxID=2784346 RepID=A0ABS2TY85_9ACTN|nr:hypothetical protein [Actinacidiphila acididurans]MBM9508308.1 hypothetical protein [Actinacidiphila acididurans]